MTTKVIDLKDAAKYFGDLKKEFRAGAERGLLSAGMRGVQVIVTNIIPSRTPQPVDRGTYRAGWRAQKVQGGAEIFNDDPTAIFVEEGVRAERVRPGRAMVTALTSWVARKGLASADQAPGVAWAVIQRMKAKGIFNRGSKGLGIMKEFVNKHLDRIMFEEVDRELKRSLNG